MLLLLWVGGKAQAGGINPTVADLIQLPYRSGLDSGVCTLDQGCCVGDVSKTVALSQLLRSGLQVPVTGPFHALAQLVHLLLGLPYLQRYPTQRDVKGYWGPLAEFVVQASGEC